MQLSKKPKDFCEDFAAYLKSAKRFEHFQKKGEPHSCCISKNIDSEGRGYLNV